MAILDIAMGTANALTGGAVNKLLSTGQDNRQLGQQNKLMDIQTRGAREMSDYQMMNQKQLWDLTNAEAQMEHYKKAGLNPALMYDQGGSPGISSGGSAAMPTGGQAEAPSNQTRNALEIGMMMSQQQLIQAQTEKAKAEAIKIAGADTENTTQNTELAKIKAQLEGKSLEDQLEIIRGQARQEWSKAIVQENSAESQIGIAKQNLVNLAIEATAKQSGIELNQAKIDEISNGIAQKWQEINQTQTKNSWEHEDRIKAINEYTSNALKVAGIQAAGHIVGDIVKIATRQPQQIKKEQ